MNALAKHPWLPAETLDLTEDKEFGAKAARWMEVSRIAREAEAERKALAAWATKRLGNASSALGPEGFYVTVHNVNRRQHRTGDDL